VTLDSLLEIGAALPGLSWSERALPAEAVATACGLDEPFVKDL
jgi:hypothetical protein